MQSRIKSISSISQNGTINIINDRLILTFSIIAYYFYCISILLGINNIVTIFGVIFALPYLLIKLAIYKHVNLFFFTLFTMLCIGSILNLLVSKKGIGGIITLLGRFSLTIFIMENP